MTVRILTGDCRTMLATLPDASVQCCVTSPPYANLRDYGHPDQIGAEATAEEYISELVNVFRLVRRALRDDGTVWLNLGDGMADKQLRMIPARVALALRADGWWLRSDIIWAKPNPMPESVTDRPTSAHEHVFLLSKRASYFWDAEAVAEPAESFGRQHTSGDFSPKTQALKDSGHHGKGGDLGVNYERATRNLRNVWTIATQPFSGKTYDFAGADYVDDHGIPRKLSPDCRVHGLREQLRPETPSASVCGGLKADPCIRTSTDDRPALGQPHAADPTESYTGSSALDNRSKRNAENTLASKTPSLPPCAEVDGTQSSNSGIQQPDAQPMPGFDPHVVAQIANASSTQSRRTDPGSRSLQRDIAFASLPQNTPHSGQEPGETQLCERTRESKSGADRPASHETPTALSEPASHTSRTRSGKSSKQDKCSCPISKVDHFAVMPPDLAERCIKAGTSERGQCPHCGAPWARVTSRGAEAPKVAASELDRYGTGDAGVHRKVGGQYQKWLDANPLVTTGWSPTCSCPAHTPVPQTVLDPFFGAGTTGLVSDRLGRNCIGIELNPAYAALARNRVTADAPLFAEVAD